MDRLVLGRRDASFEAATATGSSTSTPTRFWWLTTSTDFKALTGRVWREAFDLVETNYTWDVGDGGAVTVNALRVFRNRPHYRFEGRLHEQIAQHLPTYADGSSRARSGSITTATSALCAMPRRSRCATWSS